jgi:RimJ/RimL family protein N-acetyltransferase
VILYERDKEIAAWVARNIPGIDDFGPCAAVGVVQDDQLVAGVVWSGYRDHDIQASVYAASPRWLARPRETLRDLFTYPFDVLGCRRVTTYAARSNVRALKMNKRLGFVVEGCLRKGWDGQDDAIMFGMLRGDCRWLKEPGS